MNNKHEAIKEYVLEICSYIKNREVHKEVSDEISNHIYEIVDENIEAGYSEDKAIENALLRLGSARECGIELNKIHKAKPDIISILFAGILLFIGIITMFSIKNNNIVQISLYKNILGIVIGTSIGVILYFADYRKFKKYSYFIYFGSLLVFSIYRYIETDLLVEFNQFCDDRIYFHLFMVVVILFSLCGIIELKRVNDFKNLCTTGIVGALPLYLLFNSSDFISSFIYLCGINIIFINSQVKKNFKLYLITVEIVCTFLCAFVFCPPYISGTLYGMINPVHSNEYKTLVNVKNMLLDSGVFGSHINSIVFKIPNIEVSFTLSYIVYRFGIITGVLCVVSSILFIIRIFNIRKKVNNSYGRVIIFMIASVFFIEVAANILSNLGITAIFMGTPFISFGFFNLIVNIGMLGMLCSIYRRRRYADLKDINYLKSDIIKDKKTHCNSDVEKVVVNAINMGMRNDIIINLTGFSEEMIDKLRN